jgi:SPP1 family holin
MKNVSSGTIVRTIVLIITLINTVLTGIGKNPLPFSDEQVYTIVSNAATVVASLWAWWKNNSFTKNAIAADEYMKELKNEGE